MSPTDISIAGAVDLSALKARATAPPPAEGAAPAPGAASSYVVDVTDATFEDEVLRTSLEVPVVLDLWADWCGPCKQLSPVLERLADEAGGAWVLAKLDVDRNPSIAGQLQVQSIPTVFVAIGGRLMPGFQGALPEREVRAFLEQVMAAAQQMGLPGRTADGGAAEPAPVPTDPEVLQAEEALSGGDWAAAVAAYDALLARKPGDAEAVAGRAWAALLQRAADLDPQQVMARADAAPDDVDAQLSAADVEVLSEQIQGAIDRLVGVVRRTAGDEREKTRLHLLGILDALDPADPIVLAGRRSLANALF